MRVSVYTAIFGDYDDFRSQHVHIELFNKEDGYEDKIRDLHPRMKAKYFKCMPHEVLDCDYSIWLDGSATIHDPNFVQRILNYMGEHELMCFVHPEGRTDIYQEAEYCKDFPKYKDQPIMNQVNTYRQEGYPDRSGLWACGMVVRKHTDKVKKFNEMWWDHNLKYTYQDQLSFPVCVDRTGVSLKTLWLNQHDNDLVTFMTPHKTNL